MVVIVYMYRAGQHHIYRTFLQGPWLYLQSVNSALLWSGGVWGLRHVPVIGVIRGTLLGSGLRSSPHSHLLTGTLLVRPEKEPRELGLLPGTSDEPGTERRFGYPGGIYSPRYK